MASQDLNFDETLKSLYAQYKERGYITEDQILDCAYSADILSKLTEKLLDLGVVIQEESVKIDAAKGEENYDASRTDYDALFKKIVEEYPELRSFIKYVKKIQAPQFKEWQTLIPQAKNGNKWAENRLFEMYLRLVVRTAWNQHNKYNIDFFDAIQEGAAGLLSAIEKYDMSEYNAFSAFIARPIANFITRNCDFPNYVLFDIPALVKENLFKIYDIYENHQCAECMCKPRKNECTTLQKEIMAKLECSLDDAQEYLNILTEHEHDIFDLAEETDYSAFDEVEQKNLRAWITRLMSELDPKEETVLRLRYSDLDRTLEDVGNMIGVTRERVRQIEQKALNKFKHPTRARILRGFLDGEEVLKRPRIIVYSEDLTKNDVIKVTPQKTVENKEKRIVSYPFMSRKKNIICSLKRKKIPGSVDWDNKNLYKLQKYVNQGMTISTIAAKMGLSKGAVSGKLNRLGWKTKNSTN